MNSYASTYHLTGTPQPSAKSEALPLAITLLGIAALVLTGAPLT